MKKITNAKANKMFYDTEQDHGDGLSALAHMGIEIEPLSKPVFDYTDDEGNDVYTYHVIAYVKDCAYEATGHSLYMDNFFKSFFK